MNKIDGAPAQLPLRHGLDARPAAPAEPGQVQAFEAAMKSPPGASRPAPTDAPLQLWLQGASLATALTGMDRTQQRETVWKWYRQDLPESAEGRRDELREWLMHGLSDRLLAHFPQQRGGLEPDRLALKDLLKEQAPFGKQQETLLLNVLGEIKGVEGSEYLSSLVRSELQTLIPLNAMIKNLMSFTHSPDLES
ncbi:YopR/YscH family type III secretion effector [Pseudomonas sp. PH1b]|uniref:YopR/YscH family type III secretion effector n=1 Tax=Pseudomonas sp. PH1b TaxID=1397282 RepID=UPI00046A8F3B|nr:YopR/YscH family type III secretion effector [Pseudomonas sp. PH1b]